MLDFPVPSLMTPEGINPISIVKSSSSMVKSSISRYNHRSHGDGPQPGLKGEAMALLPDLKFRRVA